MAEILRDIMSLLGIDPKDWTYGWTTPSGSEARFKWRGRIYRLRIDEVTDAAN